MDYLIAWFEKESEQRNVAADYMSKINFFLAIQNV
jgi:hypothetical protein